MLRQMEGIFEYEFVEVGCGRGEVAKMTGQKTYDVAVVGAGVFGAWTAWHLARGGQRVALVEAYGPGNSRASSGGETRIIRMGYGADELYSLWSQRSLVQWRDFLGAVKQPLFLQTGVLLARRAVAAVVEDAVRRGVEYRSAQATNPREAGRVEHIVTSQGERIAAGQFVFACGAWLGKIFPDVLGARIFPSRQEVFFF